MKCIQKVRNMPKKRLQAVLADRAVWQKLTKGRARIMWVNVVHRVWKDIGGNQEIYCPYRSLRGRKINYTPV